MTQHQPPNLGNSNEARIAQKFADFEKRLAILEQRDNRKTRIVVMGQDTACTSGTGEKQVGGGSVETFGGHCYVGFNATGYRSPAGAAEFHVDMYENEGKKEWRHMGGTYIYMNIAASHTPVPFTVLDLGEQHGVIQLALISTGGVVTDENDHYNMILFEV